MNYSNNKKIRSMAKISKLILMAGFILAVSGIVAQERIYVKKKEYKQTESGFGTSWQKIKKANRLFYQHRAGSYQKAVPLYLDALQYNSENAELNLLLGISYLRSWPKEKSLPYIQKAIDLNEKVHPSVKFHYARALHYSGEFNKAIIAYGEYKDAMKPNEQKKYGNIIDKYVVECESGIALRKKQIRALIDNMGNNINSASDDYNTGFFSEGNYMAFTSRRPGTGKLKSPMDHYYHEDIYFSRKVGNVWDVAENAGDQLNSSWNDAFVEISLDGNKMIVFKGRKNKGALYTYTQELGIWGHAEKMTPKVNKRKAYNPYACFNGNGTRMYFISDRKGGAGGRDIYTSTLDEKGKKWSDPVNLGMAINTPYDEVSVFVLPDESALYFSSNGHNSIGGFDVFKSVRADGEWTEPVNIGMPVNTTADEIFFRLMPNKRDAYFASNNQSGQGGFDIYSVTMLCPEKPGAIAKQDELLAGMINPVFEPSIEKEVELSYTRMTIVKGKVTDYNTGQPIGALVELVDNKTGKKEKDTKADLQNGAYLISLPSGKNYGFSVNADGYMFHSENFNVPEASGYKEIIKDIRLQPMTAGSKIILYNTFFDTGKSNLRAESYSELNRLAAMFDKYPNLVIEISGHTDNRGSKGTNQVISNARAKSVVNYLLSQGVKPQNLKAVGYYFLYPVANNKTEEGRQQNRRVEAKILRN
jgi:outer membrane protein OmpA-like peptidoglycan-associated protein/tetratricopeptide (TPR) repeat protein